MTQPFKRWIKYLLQFIPVHLTKNMAYDAQTKQIIKRVCHNGNNCIDIGCHKGEIMDLFLQQSPNGQHMGFEPIPSLYEALRQKYKNTACDIRAIALSNQKGQTSFQFVRSNPAYSGLLKRRYQHEHEEIEEIRVDTDLLDNCVPADQPVQLIKIDVEGGEWQVLQGAVQTITRNKPYIIFEHGLGASEFYGATPAKIFALLSGCGLQVSTLKHWLDGKPSLSLPAFEEQFTRKINYYFIAHP